MNNSRIFNLYNQVYYGDNLPHHSVSLSDRDVVRFLMPDISPEQVNVYIEKGILYVEMSINEGNVTTTRLETFFMEEYYDINGVKSNLNRGILTVDIPFKKEYMEVLNVEVKVSE